MMIDYSTVTEVAGERVSQEAAAMMRERYQFVAEQIEGQDLLEVSCGAGQGLGFTARRARKVVGADITANSLRVAHNHYGDRIPLVQCDAQALPFMAGTFDICAIHEAIYYYADTERAFDEVHRVLRPGGRLVISTINPDWPDFNPSPFSTKYLDAIGLAETLRRRFGRVEMFAAFPVVKDSLRARALSALKRFAVAWGLIPRTMKGKRLLKRLVFGTLVTVPPELSADGPRASVVTLPADDTRWPAFKVIYAVAQRP